jgi:predicted RNA binding protein YcfA (HicA-like mRNA interferase family)
MSQWRSCKSRVLLRALNRIGWTLKRDAKGSHRILAKEGWPDVIFAFHDGEEVGPRMLARVAKQTGLKPEDL